MHRKARGDVRQKRQAQQVLVARVPELLPLPVVVPVLLLLPAVTLMPIQLSVLGHTTNRRHRHYHCHLRRHRPHKSQLHHR